ncbi:hypothetical protein [Pedobacter heparinus]|uniref:hypothetical protein n=1 Tax=Pedobacter heparinus TaxID=984 RepID=UPI00292D41DB|nr:hypothetical protein [Pedobacter heparinus]
MENISLNHQICNHRSCLESFAMKFTNDDKKMRGLIYGLYYPSLKRIGHCGITERLQGDLIFGIEANTSLAGSREGDGVYRKIRHKRTIYCYADWTRNGAVK